MLPSDPTTVPLGPVQEGGCGGGAIAAEVGAARHGRDAASGVDHAHAFVVAIDHAVSRPVTPEKTGERGAAAVACEDFSAIAGKGLNDAVGVTMRMRLLL